MSLYEFWHEIVRTYSTGQLTKPEDRFLAISGAAKEVRHLIGDRYVAGLWEGNLANDLLWAVDSSSAAGTFPSAYRAPTWSWASLDAEIIHIYPGSEFSKDTIHAGLSAETSYTTDEDTGLVAYGRIRVHGQLHEVIPDEDRGWAMNGRYVVSCSVTELEVYLDLGWNHLDTNYGQPSGSSWEHKEAGFEEISKTNALLQHISSSQSYYLLPIRTRTYVENPKSYMGGLILTPTGCGRGEWIRVGMFFARQEKALQVLLMASSKLDPDLWIEDTGDGQYVFDIV